MLKIYNTLSRKKENFEPLHPPFVGMYVCGPTVYDNPHLGHAKSYISFDVILRFLRASDYKVRYVQNITDVGHLLGDGDEGEDRILKKASIEKLEPVEVAQKYERSFFKAMDALNCLRPDISARATGHVHEMIEWVVELLDKGFAYKTGDNIYFDVPKFKDYGKLSGRKLDDMLSGTRVETAGDKRHPADFALWKKADAQHLMQWSSPWGMGYPGWHLECSVMASKYLGETIDIHGGGLDNQFPHHECEIAQSEAKSGKPFVKYWIHHNMVTVDGQKMSKSLGNFTTVEELIGKYDPMTVRFFILQSHYRSPQDFSDDALSAAQTGFSRLVATVKQLQSLVEDKDLSIIELEGDWAEYRNRFFDFMEDDFNTAGAITILFEIVKNVNILMSQDPKSNDLIQAYYLFEKLGENILGFNFKNQNEDFSALDDVMTYLLGMRQEFRKNKNFQMADSIRDHLAELGFSIEDSQEGSKWKKN